LLTDGQMKFIFKLFKKTRRVTGEDVRFVGGFVLKSYKDNVSGEFEKAENLYKLTKFCNFSTPHPLECNFSSATIKYSYVPNTQSIREKYIDFMKSEQRNKQCISDFYNAGIALGEIHSNLKLKNFKTWTPDKHFIKFMGRFDHKIMKKLLKSKQVFSHCDYGFSNVHFSEKTEEIVVFDPSSNGFITQSSVLLAPIYLDLANFICNLNGLIPLRMYAGVKWNRMSELKDIFISGYEDSSGNCVDKEVLEAIVYVTARKYFNYKYQSRLLRFVAINALFNFYKGNRIIL